MKTQLRLYRLGLTHFIITIVISSSFECEENAEWQCKSGDCLAVERVCDGVSHCPDGSDETADICLQTVCEPFFFRCTYGACVSKEAQCNRKLDCVDGSDEADGLCKPDLGLSNTICSNQEFQCVSGTCIGQQHACNGETDCPDNSDETARACSANLCSARFFRCGYGACIEASKKCDGHVDCHDGTDESSCEINFPTFVNATSSCIAPSIMNSRLVYEHDESQEIQAGAEVPNYAQMTYKCRNNFYREGQASSVCYNGKWMPPTHSSCKRHCKGSVLKGVTFSSVCFYDNSTVECGERIRPGTFAKTHCSFKYRIPSDNPRQTLLCEDNGEWDYPPSKCEPVCGEALVESVPFAVKGVVTNITAVPWHVAIYNSMSGQYEHTCGGSILNAKLVITAAHCFWNTSKGELNNRVFYLIGAGKILRDYYEIEPRAAQFTNISKIYIPNEFSGPNSNFKADIAVLVLTHALTFSKFIAPICIQWKRHSAKSLLSGTHGLIAGWGKDETGKFSSQLKITNVPMSSYQMCRKEVGAELADFIKDDMFCVLSKHTKNASPGDSGGGFVVKMENSSINRHYLWGIVSNGIPNSTYYSQYEFVNYVNIQFYEDFISSVEIQNRPK